MKEIRTEDAVGHVLCHDITQIIKDEKKGVLFKKGHIVREEDIPALLSVGKEHLYVWEKQEGILHENEAAEILYRISADIHMHGSDIKEGKIKNAMIIGKGSLFLGRMTNLFDGVSFVIHGNTAAEEEAAAGVSEEEVKGLIAKAMKDFAATLMAE